MSKRSITCAARSTLIGQESAAADGFQDNAQKISRSICRAARCKNGARRAAIRLRVMALDLWSVVFE